MRLCRLCNSDRLTQFLNLGFTPLADAFLTEEELNEPEIYYPLKVMRCDKCMFIQLNYVVSSETIYQKDYPYESSMTQTGRVHFDNFAHYVTEEFKLSHNDLVIDIGSNVGVLLQGFKKRGCKVLGVDPADNIVQIAIRNGIPTISNFFSCKTSALIKKEYGTPKVITASNVFAHIDDLKSLMKAIDFLLKDDGVFIIEAPYLVHLLDNLEYDTIYHEHLSYVSITPLLKFFKDLNFDLFDVQEADIHGGSIRLFISRKRRRCITQRVMEAIRYEEENKIHSLEKLNQFAEKVKENRYKLVKLLRSLKDENKRIAGVSAPAKGMTLLNYCKIDSTLIDFVTEKSTLKIGRFTPGSHLPVLPDSALIDKNVNYALLLAWNFKDEIKNNLKYFSEKGGKFIIPIPEPIIID